MHTNTGRGSMCAGSLTTLGSNKIRISVFSHTASGEGYALFLHVHTLYGYFYYIPNGIKLGGMFYKSVAHLGDVEKSVLMHSDIDKRAEIYYVPYSSREHHPLGKVFYRQHSVSQHRRRKRVADIPARLLKLVKYVGQRYLRTHARSALG